MRNEEAAVRNGETCGKRRYDVAGKVFRLMAQLFELRVVVGRRQMFAVMSLIVG